MRNIFIMMCTVALLTACGDDEGKPASTAAPAKSESANGPATSPDTGITSEGVYKMIDGIRIVDHSRDEKEFEIRRAISGVESMIKNYKEQGMDTADLEKQLNDLKQELRN